MFISSFRANVVTRVACLAALIFIALWSLMWTTWDAVPVVAVVLLIVVATELVRYVERGTRELGHLLRAVAHGDFTTALPARSGRPPFADYEQASRTLIDTYQRLDLQRAASDELLRIAIDHIGPAVLCFSIDGNVAFANRSARELLGTSSITQIGSLAAVDPRLPPALQGLTDGERAQLDIVLHNQPAQLLLHARRFMLLDRQFSVVACQDIRDVLESRDVEAWQALTSVLTHEMMNSLTPIISLSGLLLDSQAKRSGTPVDGDVTESIDVIHERSTGLARFIQAYRQFSNPPVPMPTSVAAGSLLERVAVLKRVELDQAGIQLAVQVEENDVRIDVDAHQIEQVLINLIRNAQDALTTTTHPCIELRLARDLRGRALIHVTDNGPGIPASLQEKVFVPFFTTHAGGTGIGLSLSRQLVGLNGGTLTLTGTPGACRLTLRLPLIHTKNPTSFPRQ